MLLPIRAPIGDSDDNPPRLRISRIARTALALSLGYAALSALIVLCGTRSWRRPFRRHPRDYGLAFESVRFPSRVDSILLDGWLLLPSAAEPRRRPVVMVHGKSTDRQGEVGGRVLEVAAGLVRRGHPVLMFDLRATGRSGGSHQTLGAHEARDVAGAVDFLERRGLCPEGVLLLGYSMGAAACLLAAPSDPRVVAVAVDSGYADVRTLLEDHVPRMTGISVLLMPGIACFGRLLLGVDLHAIRPVDGAAALAARGVPLMVIHGDADWSIPIAHGRRLAAAYGPKVQTLFVPGARHSQSYLVDPAAYLARLAAFFESTGLT